MKSFSKEAIERVEFPQRSANITETWLDENMDRLTVDGLTLESVKGKRMRTLNGK